MTGRYRIFFALSLLVMVAIACSLPALGGKQNTDTSDSPVNDLIEGETPSTEQAEPDPDTSDTQSESAPISPYITGSRTYDVEHVIELKNDGPGEASRIALTVALIQTIEPYQTVNSFISDPAEYTTLDDKHENLYAQFEFVDVPAGETRTVTLTYKVIVNAIKVEMDACSGELIDEYLNAEKFIESDSSQIITVAETLKEGKPNTCALARAIYDYVGDEVTYSVYTQQDLGALTALNQLNGDCTEFADLFIALNRAAGIPARFMEGVTCCTDSGYRAGENKHDWSEVFLPGYGWVPVDATWGRFPHQRDRYFAAMSPDHIIVTRGRYLIRLNGYHYYAYNYWWDDDETSISSTENWGILEAE